MAASYEPEGDYPQEEGQNFDWPEMDMIENIIQGVREYVADQKTSAKISVEIDMQWSQKNELVQEKYSVGATSVNPSPSTQTEENDDIKEILYHEMVGPDINQGLMTLPPEFTTSTLEEQVAYLAEMARAGREETSILSNLGYMSFEELEELNKRDNGNAK